MCIYLYTLFSDICLWLLWFVGALNDGYDDQNYDYILHGDEIFAQRYILKHRIGKVSFIYICIHICIYIYTYMYLYIYKSEYVCTYLLLIFSELYAKTQNKKIGFPTCLCSY
jgi:hypothetical protein